MPAFAVLPLVSEPSPPPETTPAASPAAVMFDPVSTDAAIRFASSAKFVLSTETSVALLVEVPCIISVGMTLVSLEPRRFVISTIASASPVSIVPALPPVAVLSLVELPLPPPETTSAALPPVAVLLPVVALNSTTLVKEALFVFVTDTEVQLLEAIAAIGERAVSVARIVINFFICFFVPHFMRQ